MTERAVKVPLKVPMALRLDAELAAWLDGYSRARGVKKIVLVEAALRAFREDCAGGVPDLPSAEGVRVSAPRVSRPSGVVVEPPPADVPAAVPASRAEAFRRATQGRSG